MGVLKTKICKYCGKVFQSTGQGIYCSAECKARAYYTKNEVTLCWNCKRATGFCSWSEDFTPVEGWKAIPTKVKVANSKGRNKTFTDSYLVIECPLFERG